MLNPFAGFKPDSGHALGFANLGEARMARKQKGELAAVDDARQRDYLNFQKQQWGAGQERQNRDDQIKAFTAFQAAVDSGDTEQAAQAANVLKLLGVDVQEYGAGQGGSAGGAPPSAMAAMAKESPTAAIAQAQAKPPADKQKQMAELDQMGDEAVAATKAPEVDAEEAEIDRALADFEKNPPISKEDEEARQEFTYWAIQQKQKKEAARAEAAKPQPPNPFEGDMGVRLRPQRTTGLPEAQPEAEATAPEPAATGEQATPVSMPSLRGYRLNFGGKILEISPESIAQRQQQRVASALEPLVASATTPEEKAAALEARDMAIQLIGTTSPDKAFQSGLDFYQKTLDRQGKLKRAKVVRGTAGSGGEGYGGIEGLSKETSKRSFETGRYANQLINNTLQNSNVKNIREEIANADDALQKASSKDPLAQFASKATLQRMLMKGSLSDRDVARLEAAPGQWARLEQWANNWTEGGKVPEDVLRQIKDIANKKRMLLKQRLHEAGQLAKNRVLGDEALRTNTTPEELDSYGDQAYGDATGQFRKRKKAKKGSASADEVRKALGK